MSNDTFQWTDALVKEYLDTRLGDTYKDLEDFKRSKQRPPVGVHPEWAWKEIRVDELREAIVRYQSNNIVAPKEWVKELGELSMWLANRKNDAHNKEWEIIQIVNSRGGTIYKDRDDISWEQYADLHSFEGFTIKKVKRLSDGEIFSVGDYVKWAHHEPFNITGFRIGLKDAMYCLDSEELPYYLTEVKKCSPQHKKEWGIEDCFDNNGNRKSWHPYDKGCNDLKCEIRSVRRLSDNEVFTVGDEVEYRSADASDWGDICGYGKINWFKISLVYKSSMEVEINDEYRWRDAYFPHKYIENIRHKKEQPKKERIEVVVEHTCNDRSDVVAYMGQGVPEEKYPQIKAAIERVLNDEDDVAPKETMIETIKRMKAEYVKRQDFDTASDWRQLERLLTNQPPIGDYMQELNLATMQQLKEAEEKAFNAAREPYCATAMGQRPQYWTFQDYINHQRDKK